MGHCVHIREMERNDDAEASPLVARPGDKLREWRKAKGLTLVAAAGRLGLTSPSTVSEYERGSRKPSYASAQAIQKITRGAVRVEEWGFDKRTGRRAVAA